MFDFIFSHLWGWIGVTGIIVLCCIGVAIIIPQFRAVALAVAAGAIGAASIYAKGQRDRAALEQRRKDEAVRKVNEKYDEIERRKDTPDDVDKRFKDGSF